MRPMNNNFTTGSIECVIKCICRALCTLQTVRRHTDVEHRCLYSFAWEFCFIVLDKILLNISSQKTARYVKVNIYINLYTVHLYIYMRIHDNNNNNMDCDIAKLWANFPCINDNCFCLIVLQLLLVYYKAKVTENWAVCELIL